MSQPIEAMISCGKSSTPEVQDLPTKIIPIRTTKGQVFLSEIDGGRGAEPQHLSRRADMRRLWRKRQGEVANHLLLVPAKPLLRCARERDIHVRLERLARWFVTSQSRTWAVAAFHDWLKAELAGVEQ
jgi:hypothetical protein